jgi:tetratricopeptide (TPR) repeat protein
MIRSQKELAEVVQPAQEKLSQTEKLLLRYEAILEWSRDNQRTLIGIGVVLIAAAAGLWWWAGQRKANSEHADTYLSRAANFYFGADYRHAIDGDKTRKLSGDPIYGLRYIVEEYGSTNAGKRAALLLANSYYAIGKYDSAMRAFDKASSDFPLMQASIEAGKASIYEHRGNKIDAAKLFESAARRDETNPLDADYLLSAARDFEGAKNKDDAVRIYRQLLADFPRSQFDDAAQRELLKLNVEL